MKEYFREINVGRPTPLKKLDQVYMDEKSVMKTCIELGEIVRNKKLLFIGDDDLLSIYLSKFYDPKSTVVIDIDMRIIKHIKMLREKLSLKNLMVVKHDIRDPLPTHISNNFDIFYTNPPYGSKNNGDSCIAFIIRGLESLKLGGQGVFVIASSSEGQWASKVEIKVTEYVRNSGCKLLRKSTTNQTYFDNEITSTMFVAEKTSNSLLPVQISKISLY